MIKRTSATAAWLVLLSIFFAMPALAASIDEQVAAQIQLGDQLFEQAKQAYAAKNYKVGNSAYSDAVKAYGKAIELDPKSYLAHRKLGDMYFGESSSLHNYDAAIASYKKALEVRPDSAYVFSQLSRCYLTQDRFTQAIAAGERSIQLNPGDAAGYYNLGFIYADMGNNEEARKFQARLQTMNASLAQQLGIKIGESSRLTSNIERPKTFSNPKIALVAIKPGGFMLGADDKKGGRQATIRKGFSIGKYPVTQAQWQMVMGDNPSFHKKCGGDCPVESVSWNDAQLFISRLNSLKDGRRYRLPSEAEWEFAYKAGRPGKEFENINDHWWSQNSGATTHPVGQKPANPWGIYDMGGHVQEWCMDYFVTDPEALPLDGSPLLNTAVKKYRSLRGQSYYVTFYGNPGVKRSGLMPQDTNWNVGLRVAADK